MSRPHRTARVVKTFTTVSSGRGSSGRSRQGWGGLSREKGHDGVGCDSLVKLLTTQVVRRVSSLPKRSHDGMGGTRGAEGGPEGWVLLSTSRWLREAWVGKKLTTKAVRRVTIGGVRWSCGDSRSGDVLCVSTLVWWWCWTVWLDCSRVVWLDCVVGVFAGGVAGVGGGGGVGWWLLVVGGVA
ncbi:hypothetical protein RIF29_25082 [Crotalaria pallida]|uniref:Uncharacterized protein n=1 Tax=Crotalaria pallida TaxID=3830 RepID=A0AAN9ELR9_CROPI